MVTPENKCTISCLYTSATVQMKQKRHNYVISEFCANRQILLPFNGGMVSCLSVSRLLTVAFDTVCMSQSSHRALGNEAIYHVSLMPNYSFKWKHGGYITQFDI